MEIIGKVSFIRKDKKGVQLENGNWYSNPNMQSVLEVNKGDEVKIEFAKNGQFNNLQKLEITKKNEKPEISTQTAIDQNAEKRRELDEKHQQEINRTEALKIAVNQAAKMAEQLEKAKIYFAFILAGMPATEEEIKNKLWKEIKPEKI